MYLTNYGHNLFLDLLKLFGYWLPANTLYFFKKRKKLVDIGWHPIKYAYQAFIIQNFDVLTLKLDMKVQFANF
jgi:hypothetical protein